MHIDKNLNLVVPIRRADKTQLYVHSMPIMPATFETYYLVLARAWQAFASNGLDPRSAPSVAQLVLRDIAKSTPRPGHPEADNWWDGNDGVGGPAGLMAEMIRLSNAIVASPDEGWTSMPLQHALDQKLVSEEERSELLNLLAFFTVVSRAAPRVDRARLIEGEAAIFELQSTFSSSTEFLASLKTSTAAVNTGAKT